MGDDLQDRSRGQRERTPLSSRGWVDGRVDCGTTKSIHANDPDSNVIELVHELPRAVWEDDIDAALNRATDLPVRS